MRISSASIHDANVSLLNQQNDKMLHTQQQLGTGRRILTPADDPYASARALEISQSDSANTQYEVNRNAAKHTATNSESILKSVIDLLQDVRTATVQDGSGVLTREDKQALATDLRGRYEELIGLANSTDGVGNYLFSGYQGRTLPFVKNNSGVQYMADDGQRMIQVDSSRQIAASESGADIFMRIKNGNGKFTIQASPYNAGTGITSQGVITNPKLLTGQSYQLKFSVEEKDHKRIVTYDVINPALDPECNEPISSGNPYKSGHAIELDGMQFDIQGEPEDGDIFNVTPSVNESIFTTLENLMAALNTANDAGGEAATAQYTNNVNRALNNIDRGLQNVITIRTSLGSRLREIDALQATGEDLGLQYKKKLSELQDVDFNKSVSDLNQQQTSLTAAQKSFKQVSDLSLFNYI
jgi:flagellar hook-associated protein 3 FlgL